MVLALTITLNSMGVERSSGKEARNGGRPTCSSCFFPSDRDHFLLGPRKGLEWLGQAREGMASAV